MEFAASLGIAVVGLGRAGAARVRASRASSSFELRAIVSRRAEAATASFEQVLADPEIAAVAICTENATHAELAARALEARKHVLVEYPLALRCADYAELYALATARGRVLHEEHIELLTASHRAWRERLALRAAPIVRATIASRGGIEGWIGDPGRAGFASFAAIARLHVLDDLFGPLQLISAEYRAEEGGIALRVELRGARGEELLWTHERRRGLAHATELRVETTAGALEPPPSGAYGDLFARDLALFAQGIARGAPAAHDVERNLRCARLAAEIEAFSWSDSHRRGR
ncbi:MAG: Gfo/Idh/MocA family oxidoreductase [Planctomycetes bacterium]|nr:Gfo/Idh/MocA family oxidoreductase [Planctomycetota bacterium]